VDAAALAIELRTTNEHEVQLLLSGELDLSTAATLRTCVEDLPDGVRSVTMDLSELAFIDSTGIAMLLSFQRSFDNDFRRLTVRCPQGTVRRVLRVSGVEERLAVVG
jgi:anti-anti-sigma factor